MSYVITYINIWNIYTHIYMEISSFILEKKMNFIEKPKNFPFFSKRLSFDTCIGLLKLKRNSQIRTLSHFYRRLGFNGDTIGIALKE